MSTLMNDHQLSKQTSIFGLHLWIVLGVSAGAAFVLLLFLLTLCLASISKQRRTKTHNKPNPPPPPIPAVSREIRVDFINLNHNNNRVQPDPVREPRREKEESDQGLAGQHPRIQIEIGKGHHRILFPEKFGGGLHPGDGGKTGDHHVGPGVSHLGWGHWYTLRELELCTNGFSDGNVIGQGGYGIVYHGVLEDNTQVAVKNLLNTRGQAEKEFEVEVEAIGRVRHKNLLRLLGYCAEGAHRILVYEYVNNGNLEQWLHGDVGPYSPLMWEIRMKIVLGTAKALTYLHEGLEPKVVHRDIKSSNILLDKCWNPKLSDFGLAKLLGANMSYITTRVMGTFGYVAPEYANTGMLNERSDVYSFGVLFLELISGRNPVDHNRPQEEVYLVDWVKKMVSNRNPERVLDPKLPEKPSSRALKRALLVAIRCVDVDAQKRPKMGNVVHMLEAEAQFSINDRRLGKESPVAHHGSPNDESNDKQMTKSSDNQQ